MDCENNFYKVLKSANKIICLECKKQVSGTNSFNIKRHYKLIHKKDITQNTNERNGKGAPTKKRKIEEDVKINFYRVLKSAKKIVCLECKKQVSGTNSFNIRRHYKLVHKKDITQNPNESDDEGAQTEKRKIEEDVKVKIDKSPFLECVDCENNFYKVLKSDNKIICLECEKQVIGTNFFNIKKHYKLVHNKDITQNPNESDDEGAPTEKRKLDEDAKINIDEGQFLECVDCENNFYRVLKSANKIVCLECKKQVSGTNFFNIKTHYKLVHNKDISQNPNESDDEGAQAEKRKIEGDVKGNIDKSQFLECVDRENNFYKVLKSASKIICLECEQQVIGTNFFNIKRHYKLVHKKDITQNSNGSDDEGAPTEKRKIEEDVKINIDKSKFLKYCVGLVVVQNLPFRIFDDSDFFKDLISPYENKFETNLNSRNIVDVIEVCYAKVQQIITKRVKNKMLSIKFDTTSRMDKSFLGINIQYIKDFKIYTNTIGIIQLTKRHKAVHLKEEILSCLKMYQIDIEQIYSSTFENGANMLKVSQIFQDLHDEQINEEESDEESIGPEDNHESIHQNLAVIFPVVRCATHTIQLSAHDVLNELSQQISECRDAVKQLRKIVKSGDIQMEMPTLDNATRWNSTYEMFLSLLNARDYIDPLNTEMYTIPDINWKFINHFVAAFKPLVLYSKQLQKEQYVIGDFYRDWLCCEIELEELFSVTPFSSLLYSSMQKRKKLLLNNNAFLAALYLDPRFNFESSNILSKQQRCQAIEHLMKSFDVLITWRKKSQEHFNEMNFASSSPIIQSELPTSSFAKLEQRVIAEITRTPLSKRSHHFIKEKLKLLENKQKLPFGTDVLNYWKTSGDDDIKSIAEVALTVPASQVSVERAFSALSVVLTKSKLNPKTLNNLLITKLNFKELSDENIFFEATADVSIKTNDKYNY